MTFDEIINSKILSQIYEKMSDEDKLTFTLLKMQETDHREIMDALKKQSSQINSVVKQMERHNWWVDFASDIAANFTTDGLIFLGTRLLRKI